MNAQNAKKPRMSLQKYLERQYKPVFERYKKLALAMNDCGVFKVYQFRKGLERMTGYEVSRIEVEACVFWGQVDVQKTLSSIRLSGWGMYKDLQEVVQVENRHRRIKLLRTTCGPEKPAPDDAPVEVLDLPEAMKELFKRKKITELRCIVSCTRERLEFFYGFTPEILDEINVVISKVGRTFYQKT